MICTVVEVTIFPLIWDFTIHFGGHYCVCVSGWQNSVACMYLYISTTSTVVHLVCLKPVSFDSQSWSYVDFFYFLFFISVLSSFLQDSLRSHQSRQQPGPPLSNMALYQQLLPLRAVLKFTQIEKKELGQKSHFLFVILLSCP